MNPINFISLRLVIFVVFVAALFSGTAARAGNQTDAGEDVASAWMRLVDAQDYASSWEQASGYFKSVITPAQWADAVSEVRAPLGDVQERNQIEAAYSTMLPGAPVGEYVVIKYETVFEHRNVIETVTTMIDADKWRVTGYFVK